jgi:hypothetical protein
MWSAIFTFRDLAHFAYICLAKGSIEEQKTATAYIFFVKLAGVGYGFVGWLDGLVPLLRVCRPRQNEVQDNESLNENVPSEGEIINLRNC